MENTLGDATSGRVAKAKPRKMSNPTHMNKFHVDFDSLIPSDIKEINTNYDAGKTRILSDGRTITARSGSSGARPTFVIREANGRRIEISYGE